MNSIKNILTISAITLTTLLYSCKNNDQPITIRPENTQTPKKELQIQPEIKKEPKYKMLEFDQIINTDLGEITLKEIGLMDAYYNLKENETTRFELTLLTDKTEETWSQIDAEGNFTDSTSSYTKDSLLEKFEGSETNSIIIYKNKILINKSEINAYNLEATVENGLITTKELEEKKADAKTKFAEVKKSFKDAVNKELDLYLNKLNKIINKTYIFDSENNLTTLVLTLENNYKAQIKDTNNDNKIDFNNSDEVNISIDRDIYGNENNNSFWMNDKEFSIGVNLNTENENTSYFRANSQTPIIQEIYNSTKEKIAKKINNIYKKTLDERTEQIKRAIMQ
ncbi:hypothetical protein K9L67_01680 [Candidatus Woesearchaeota archaeon]|nr:hypothetical protein [Candidatus Woesearchaeota archaeon]MCF7900914.1 hypothetical protein [Candidatus Woesearchaeota archaeon]MCF8013037.1 hypothetical protein [Candidatus Woesearchaeota archaeon]